MATTNQDAANLLAVLESGLIKEDLMSTIFDVSKVPFQFSGRAGNTRHSNPGFSWPMDRYVDPDPQNAVVDGADITQNDTVEGQRVWNQSQTSVKAVRVSSRADASDVVGRANTLSRQVSRRTHELARDVETMALKNQTAVEDDGSATAGRTAGLESWIDGQRLIPAASGATTYTQTAALQQLNTAGTITGGGWSNRAGGSKIVPAWNYAAVTPGAMTETAIKNIMRALYENTGERKTRDLMVTPELNDTIADFYFTSSARIATLIAQQGDGTGPREANGAVNSILTNFGRLDITPNILHPAVFDNDGTTVIANTTTAFVIDFDYVSLSYLFSYRMEPLAKTGLANNRLLSVDWGLKVLNSEALGMAQGVNPALAMTP